MPEPVMDETHAHPDDGNSGEAEENLVPWTLIDAKTKALRTRTMSTMTKLCTFCGHEWRPRNMNFGTGRCPGCQRYGFITSQSDHESFT